MKQLQRRWMTLAGRLGLPDAVAGEVFAKFESLYSVPPRAYHTLDHIAQCLRHFEDLRNECEHPDAVETALWFHDSIYFPRNEDNEEQSAQLAVEVLEGIGLSSEFAARVGELVRVTRHDRPPRNRDEAVIVDADLASLGAAPARFNGNSRAIREEFAWVPEPEYCEARAAILQGFLDRSPLYHTALFRERFEERARQNLRRALKQLRKPPV